MRLFAGDRIYKILNRLGGVDEEGNEEPIEARMLSRQIEKAQRKVEEQNFVIRKRVLEYDDVMNQQREVIYAYRDRILEGRDMREDTRERVGDVLTRLVEEYTPGDYLEDWDLDALFAAVAQIFPVDFSADSLSADELERELLARRLSEEAMALYDQREEQWGDELTRALERYLLLQIIDQRWKEHLYDMDYLREGIHLRGFAQSDPLVEYKNEGFTLFTDLMNTIWSDFARMIFNVEVNVEGPNGGPPAPQRFSPGAAGSSSTGGGAVRYSSGGFDPRAAMAMAAAGAVEGGEAYADEIAAGGGMPATATEAAPAHVEQRRVDETAQIGRNDPCWCGSGKKYKKCHGA